MKISRTTNSRLFCLFAAVLFFLSALTVLSTCAKNANDSHTFVPAGKNELYNLDALGIPKFVSSDYIELAKINSISKFRSSVGHSYSDHFESCRSMKHYYVPKTAMIPKIFAPVNGAIVSVTNEWAGAQIRIESQAYPAFYFILFHVNLNSSLNLGSSVSQGQQLGTHIGSLTWSDIAIGVNTPTGWRLISYFEVMTDDLFQQYVARGLNNRSDAIISKVARDLDLLTCNGESFTGSLGSISSWEDLN